MRAQGGTWRGQRRRRRRAGGSERAAPAIGPLTMVPAPFTTPCDAVAVCRWFGAGERIMAPMTPLPHDRDGLECWQQRRESSWTNAPLTETPAAPWPRAERARALCPRLWPAHGSRLSARAQGREGEREGGGCYCCVTRGCAACHACWTQPRLPAAAAGAATWPEARIALLRTPGDRGRH